ncbi:MAG: hypothetical protein NC924_08810 [Candidatus Omnitrophica bacterium]|nr:hypothetical protein [Candidatus Omnitrophota bacterium]
MIDRTLEEKIKQVKEFIDLWASFYNTYKKAAGQPSFTDEEEKNFLELKSTLARKYQAMMDSMGLKPTAEDRTFDVISQVMSLKSIPNLSPLQIEKLENDWHNSYITLNKIMGSLENKRNELAKVNVLGKQMSKLLMNPFVTLLLLLFLISGIYALVKNVWK